jgi:hypothetical protein
MVTAADAGQDDHAVRPPRRSRPIDRGNSKWPEPGTGAISQRQGDEASERREGTDTRKKRKGTPVGVPRRVTLRPN